MENVCKRDELIVNYMPLANKLAWKKSSHTPLCVSYEELQSAAYFGLVDAANKYDESRGVGFATYAKTRIWGAIGDYLRSLNWFGQKNPITPTSVDAPIGEDCKISDIIVAEDKTGEDTIDFFEEATKVLDGLGSKVISLYYIQGLSLEEIGEDVDLSKGRISQILGSCRTRMELSLIHI